MRRAMLVGAMAVLASVLGGCGGTSVYSVTMQNGSEQTLGMDIRRGEGGDADPVLATQKVARGEKLVWSGSAREQTYFRAVRLENDVPTGAPVELRLVPGSSTMATVKVVNGELQITNPVVQRTRDERPEDVVPPPNRLPSGQNPR